MEEIELFVNGMILVWKQYPIMMLNLYEAYFILGFLLMVVYRLITGKKIKFIKSVLQGFLFGTYLFFSIIWIGCFYGTWEEKLPVLIVAEALVFKLMKYLYKRRKEENIVRIEVIKDEQ